jgi:hypothetical protein
LGEPTIQQFGIVSRSSERMEDSSSEDLRCPIIDDENADGAINVHGSNALTVVPNNFVANNVVEIVPCTFSVGVDTVFHDFGLTTCNVFSYRSNTCQKANGSARTGSNFRVPTVDNRLRNTCDATTASRP